MGPDQNSPFVNTNNSNHHGATRNQWMAEILVCNNNNNNDDVAPVGEEETIEVTTRQRRNDDAIRTTSTKSIDNNNRMLNNKISMHALASTAILASTILLCPTFGHAVDVASITGTSGMMSSFAETGFYQAFSLVFVSEIGDKTFFMAGLLAMKTSKLISFVGSIGALIIMTLISVIIGQTFHAVPSGWLGGEGSFLGGLPLDDVAAVLAFAFFGLKTLQEALSMEGESVMDEELAEAEEEVEASDTTKKGTLVYVYIILISSVHFLIIFNNYPFN